MTNSTHSVAAIAGAMPARALRRSTSTPDLRLAAGSPSIHPQAGHHAEIRGPAFVLSMSKGATRRRIQAWRADIPSESTRGAEALLEAAPWRRDAADRMDEMLRLVGQGLTIVEAKHHFAPLTSDELATLEAVIPDRRAIRRAATEELEFACDMVRGGRMTVAQAFSYPHCIRHHQDLAALLLAQRRT